MISLLCSTNEHLASVQVDKEPRLEAFWSLGGIEPDVMKRKVRENDKRATHIKVDEPIDRYCITVVNLLLKSTVSFQ